MRKDLCSFVCFSSFNVIIRTLPKRKFVYIWSFTLSYNCVWGSKTFAVILFLRCMITSEHVCGAGIYKVIRTY